MFIQAGQAKSNLPSLSELLTKSVAELSEEVMTLKLELETERRSCAVLRTGLEQQQVRCLVVVTHMLSLFERNYEKYLMPENCG